MTYPESPDPKLSDLEEKVLSLPLPKVSLALFDATIAFMHSHHSTLNNVEATMERWPTWCAALAEKLQTTTWNAAVLLSVANAASILLGYTRGECVSALLIYYDHGCSIEKSHATLKSSATLAVIESAAEMVATNVGEKSGQASPAMRGRVLYGPSQRMKHLQLDDR